MSGGLLAKFYTRIVLDADNKEAVKFEKNLVHLAKSLTGITLTAIGASIALKKVVGESMNMALGMKQFSAETGASIYKLQRWQAVADKTNNSAKAVAESVKAITLNQEKIKLGQGNISGYQLLGIDPTQDPFKILEDLRTETAGLDQAMKKHVLSQIGVSKDLIQVLELTEAQFKAIGDRAFIIPRSYIETIDSARASIKELGNALGWLKASIAVALTPVIKGFTKELTRWVRLNRHRITKSIMTVFNVLGRFTRLVINASRAIGWMIDKSIGWDNAFRIMGVALLFMNRAILGSPVLWFLTALLLVLEDIYVYTQGGKSVIGLLFQKFPKLEQGALTGWKMLVEILKEALEVVSLLLTGLESLLTWDFAPFKAQLDETAKREREKFLEGGFWNVPGMNPELTKPGTEPTRKQGRNNIVTITDNRKTEINTNEVDSWELAKKIEDNNAKTYDAATMQIPKDE